MGEGLAPPSGKALQRPRAANRAVMRDQQLLQDPFKLRPDGSPRHRIDKVLAFSYLPSIKYKNPVSR